MRKRLWKGRLHCVVQRGPGDLGFYEGGITKIPLLSFLCLYSCVKLSLLFQKLGSMLSNLIHFLIIILIQFLIFFNY